MERRDFLRIIGLSSLLLATNNLHAETATGRISRVKAARTRSNAKALKGVVKHINNKDETEFPYVGSYSKYLPHTSLGDPIKANYVEMLNALKKGTFEAWENVTRPGVGKFKNPLAAVAYSLYSKDSSQYYTPPAPKMNSRKQAFEAAELYWTSILRDIHFNDYGTSSLVAEACADLTNIKGSPVTPRTIFKSTIKGIEAGYPISQLLLKDVPMGSLLLQQKNEVHLPDQEFLTDFNLWLAAQNGKVRRPPVVDPQRRYLRNARDLGEYVHIDRLVQAFYNAALIINFRHDPDYDFQLGSTAPFDKGHPYLNSTSMQGFATFDYPHLLSLVSEVMVPALKAVWHEKWYVHRKLRPEEFGARVHNHLTGKKTYPLDPILFNSTALNKIYSKYGTYLIPCQYFEGSPAHPAYPSGHATVAGACATILKAWFNEDYVFTETVMPNSDGTALIPYSGETLTLGGEINKLAWNIGFGRTLSSVHWRSDIEQGLLLGEKVALAHLEAQKYTYREKFKFTITKFDGTKVVIAN